MNISTIIAALLMAFFAVVERAEAHGYYVGPTNVTYTVLGCCGDSRTSVESEVNERYYQPDWDYSDPDASLNEQLPEYHWHRRVYTACVNRNHPAYDRSRCDTWRTRCRWERTRVTPHYAKCEYSPNYDSDCSDNAHGQYDEYEIDYEEWWVGNVFYQDAYFYEIRSERVCERYLVP